MDIGVGKPEKARKASETLPAVVEDRAGAGKRGKDEEGDAMSLLPSGGGGKGILDKGRSPISTRRKVRWNDRHGSTLVEVLEFQPSESDSDEDEFVDSCICIVM